MSHSGSNGTNEPGGDSVAHPVSGYATTADDDVAGPVPRRFVAVTVQV